MAIYSLNGKLAVGQKTAGVPVVEPVSFKSDRNVPVVEPVVTGSGTGTNYSSTQFRWANRSYRFHGRSVPVDRNTTGS